MSVDDVIRHGAPTLAGLKTGNLFPCRFSTRKELAEQLREINRVLVPRGLRLLPLRLEERRVLLYLYRPDRLSRDLSRQEVSRLLDKAGYRGKDQRACLRELARRLRLGGDFPHEIGLFLGYPPEDVQGFIDHRGKNCKCVGCWKVYGDEAAARRRFAAYKSCTGSYCSRRADGASLEALTVPAVSPGRNDATKADKKPET